MATGRPRIGFLTIGQSPREDVVPEVVGLLGRDIDIVEAGALDDLSYEEIVGKLFPSSSDTVYVSRLRDGRQAVLSKEKVIPLLQEKIEMLERKKVGLIVLLCSGEFPRFKSRVPIIYLDRVLKSFVEPLSHTVRSAGVIIPLEEQKRYAEEKWGRFFERVRVAPVSPYTGGEAELVKAARYFKAEGLGLVIMDCIGYKLRHRRVVESTYKGLVITTRTSLARYLAELLPES